MGTKRGLQRLETGFRPDSSCIESLQPPQSLEGIDARIVHTQHDEIIIEARDGIKEQVREIVKGAMENAFKQIIPEVPFVVEPRVAEAWG